MKSYKSILYEKCLNLNYFGPLYKNTHRVRVYPLQSLNFNFTLLSLDGCMMVGVKINYSIIIRFVLEFEIFNIFVYRVLRV